MQHVAPSSDTVTAESLTTLRIVCRIAAIEPLERRNRQPASQPLFPASRGLEGPEHTCNNRESPGQVAIEGC